MLKKDSNVFQRSVWGIGLDNVLISGRGDSNNQVSMSSPQQNNSGKAVKGCSYFHCLCTRLLIIQKNISSKKHGSQNHLPD